ncbi:hypothetical protein VMCG_04117 [Cytospora schulzeri]|uniref:Pathway-specific nitrogen regulator n=1 Tax=Cytospora schulzeri TaxID=448051 RepID=A0A423WU99_9PEZI|nr:hypothetical protein VMCG_04117 [Valsa malicola]
MTRAPPPRFDFDIHVDQDCVSPAMEGDSYFRGSHVSRDGTADRHEGGNIPAGYPNIEITADPDDEDFLNGPGGEPEFDSHNHHLSIHEDPDDADQTVHPDPDDHDAPSRPYSSASQSMQSFEGDGTESHRGTEDDVFSDRSPRSSIHSADEHCGEDMTEKGDETPDVRSRVTSGVSMSGVSAISDLSRLSCYEKDDFIPTSRNSRQAFRSPSSVRAMQMSSPTPSLYSNPLRSAKREAGLASTSRVGSPSLSAQYSSRGRSTPSRFKGPEPAPLVLLHVTLLPPRWVYGDMVNYFETRKLQPIAFSGEGLKNLRSAWRQLQDRLGDTEMERGILLPHPQNDYEVLEERLLEALELPLRRRARILECGHYLGPSNEMTITDYIEDDFSDYSDDEEHDAVAKKEKRHWCKSCKGDIKYQELGAERVFRIKVYASNGLMSAGAWEACWREMERVDIEVEPIISQTVQQDLSKLAASYEQEQRKQLDQQSEAGQRQRFEEERRQKFEEERQMLEAQRRDFEEQRQQLEAQRRTIEAEQHQHLGGARRQELEEEHRVLDQQRQQLEEARQQFEEERQQRLDEEELRRLQREEDEQKQFPSPRSTSRAAYVEDDLASPAPETTAATDFDGRPSDPDRLREIYGDQSRADSDAYSSQTQTETHHPDSYTQPSSQSPPSEPTYQRYEARSRSLENASLPELLGETIRVALQDPKNVAIVVLVVLIAMLAGQFSRPDERGVELYKPQPQQASYQYHELDGREPVPQLAMNTPPTIDYTETASSPSQLVETVYKTVTQSFAEKAPSRVVETIFSTVTESLVEPTAHATTEASDYTAATEVASELTPSSADPSVCLSPNVTPLPFCWWVDEEIHRNFSSYPVIDVGFDTFVVPSPSPEPELELELETEPEPHSNEVTSKTTSEDAEIDTEVDHINIAIFNPTCLVDGEESMAMAATSGDEVESEPKVADTVNLEKEEGTNRREVAGTTASTTFRIPTPQTPVLSTMTSASKEKRTVRVREFVTETVLVTATRTRSALEMKVTSRRTAPEDEDEVPEEFDEGVDNEDEVMRETLIETVKVTSTVEVDWPENTCGAFAPYTPAIGLQENNELLVL